MMQAVAGKIYSGEDEVQMIRSISVGARLATSSALRDALIPRVEGNSSSFAMRLSRIPVRSRIHSSLVSTILAISSFVKTGSGTLMPHPVICAYGMIALLFLEAAYNERGVMPTKAKGVGHDMCGAGF